jgi:hypothetical protein
MDNHLKLKVILGQCMLELRNTRCKVGRRAALLEHAIALENLGAFMLRPPTNLPYDILTRMKCPLNILINVTIYYCDISTSSICPSN